jgi:hypothetical protein
MFFDRLSLKALLIEEGITAKELGLLWDGGILEVVVQCVDIERNAEGEDAHLV